MASRTISIQLTGTNASAVAAINGVGAAAQRAGATTEKSLGPQVTSKIGSGFTKLGAAAGSIGVPFAGALSVVGGQLEQTESKTKGLGSTLSKVGTVEAVAAGAGLAFFGTAAVHAALEGEAAHARLLVAVTNSGHAYKDYSSAIEATSNKLARFGFTNVDVESSIAQLIPATHNVSKAIELQGLAADIARARNISLSDATTLLVKVEAGRYAGLTRAGLVTAAQVKGFESTADAIDLLSSKYRGAAAANAETFNGKLQALTATAHNLEEQVGNALVPQIEKLASGALATVGAFQSANSATGGWLGKLALAGAAIPIVVTAGGKLVQAGKAIAGTYETAASGLGKLAGAGRGVVAGEEAQAAAFATSADSATAKVVALAAAGVAEDKAAAATAARVSAEGALAAATNDALASDAEIVAASNAVTAARQREAIATEQAAGVRAAVPGAGIAAGAGEATTASFAAAVGPITLVAAAIGAAALALNHFFGNDNTGKIRELAVALTGVGQGADEAQKNLAKIVGTDASAGLAHYSDLVLANASAQDKATAKSQALAEAVFLGGKNAAVASTNIDTATKAIDDYAKKNGLAATQTAILGAAQKRYADDLASGSATEQQLAGDKQAVIDASRKQATTQDAVNSATQAGASAAGALADQTNNAADAAKKQVDALTALDDKLKQLNDDTLAAANSDIASKQAVLAVGDAAKTVTDKYVALSKAKNDGGQASRDFQAAQLAENSAILNVASSAEASAKSHYDLNNALDHNATAAQKVSFAIGEENAKHAAGIQALQSLKAQYPALTGAIDAYIGSLRLVPPQVSTNVQLSGVDDAINRLAQFRGNLASLNATSSIIHFTYSGPSAPGGGGGITHRAMGGPVAANKQIMVGEKGPELFVAPGRSEATVIGARGPELWSPPATGEIIPNDKVKSFAARGAGSHSTIRGYADGTAPFGSFGTHNLDPITVTFNSGSGSSGGLSSLLGAIPSTGDAVSTFEQRIADAIRAAAVRVKQAAAAAKAFTSAHTKLDKAYKASVAAQKKFSVDQFTAAGYYADQSAVFNLQNQLSIDRRFHLPTDHDQRSLIAAQQKLSADNAAKNRLSSDLVSVSKAEQAHRDANAAYVLARGAKANTLNVERQAQADAKAAADPSRFTLAVAQDQATIKQFESELKTLLGAGDKRLARVLADAGPSSAGQLALAFSKNLAKASAAERSLTSFDAQSTDYSNFVAANFKATGGPVDANKSYVVGEKGPEVFVPKSAGTIVPNGQSFNPTRGSQQIQLVLTVPVSVDGVLQGTKVVNVLLDHQRLNGPLPIRVKATA